MILSKNNSKSFFKNLLCIPKIVALLHPQQQNRSVRLSVRTPGFHPGKGGSIPPRTTKSFREI